MDIQRPKEIKPKSIVMGLFKRKKVICSHSYNLKCLDCELWIFNHDESKTKPHNIHVSDKCKLSLYGICKNFKTVKQKAIVIPKISDIEHVRNKKIKPEKVKETIHPNSLYHAETFAKA